MKLIVSLIIVIVVVLCIAIGIGMYVLNEELKGDDRDVIVSFLQEHMDNKNVAASIYYNGEPLVAQHDNIPLPLASTVKMVIAIAYAKQVASGELSRTAPVRIDELNVFYLPNTDGGAHKAWLNDIGHVTTVSMEEVAKGMIQYSSNANTEYLLHVLRIDNVNAVLQELSMPQHEQVYPFVSALGLHAEFTEAQIQAMSLADYRLHATRIHEQWLQQPLSDGEKKALLEPLTIEAQRIWSDRLPRATTAEYVQLMRLLNERAMYDASVYDALQPVLEQLMENRQNKQWLAHAGQKGGSTAFVLTMAMYATDQQQNMTELALFFDDLTPKQQAKLSRHLNSFQLAILQDEAFRTHVQQTFNTGINDE